MSDESVWQTAVADPDRVTAVERSGLLHTGREDAFDRLTELAALTTGAERACITLVTDNEFTYKSTVGVPDGSAQSGAIENSFCHYVVADSRPFFVDDAFADPRTHDHPAVGLHGIGAWAGYPVEDEAGWVLGTFCIIHSKPHEWTDDELQIVATLARLASTEVALRATQRILDDARAVLDECGDQLRKSGDAEALLVDRLLKTLNNRRHHAEAQSRMSPPQPVPDHGEA